MAKKTEAANLAFMGMMIALVFVSNYISIPTGYSRLHAANAVCLLAGMLFGGVRGGIIAGLGSAIFDLTFPAYAAGAPAGHFERRPGQPVRQLPPRAAGAAHRRQQRGRSHRLGQRSAGGAGRLQLPPEPPARLQLAALQPGRWRPGLPGRHGQCLQHRI